MVAVRTPIDALIADTWRALLTARELGLGSIAYWKETELKVLFRARRILKAVKS